MAKQSPTRQEIEALQAQIEQPKHEEVHQLKLRPGDARAVTAEPEEQLALKLNHDALRVRIFISGNPKLLERAGVRPGTKFFLS